MAGAWRKARAIALQVLHEVDSMGHEIEGLVTHLQAKGGLSKENAAFARELVSGVIHIWKGLTKISKTLLLPS